LFDRTAGDKKPNYFYSWKISVLVNRLPFFGFTGDPFDIQRKIARSESCSETSAFRIVAVRVPWKERYSGGVWGGKGALAERYWISRPLVFSFQPRCQGLCGSQK
jgi:hypothetical protein